MNRMAGGEPQRGAQPEPQRLAKRLAAQLPCSRSDAERFIAGGWVRVDGTVVEQPMARVSDAQQVTLDAKATLEDLASATLIWHKPAGPALPEVPPLPDALAAQWFAPASRFKGDRSGIRPLKVHLHNLLPAAPLAPLASGLMVFTQNPGVARKLDDRVAPIEHEWLVEVAEEMDAIDNVCEAGQQHSISEDTWGIRMARRARSGTGKDMRIHVI